MNKAIISDAKEVFARELAENRVSSLPLEQFLACACDHIQQQHYPLHDNESGVTHTAVFELVRIIRAHPELRSLSKGDALECVTDRLTTLVAAGVQDPWNYFFKTKRADAVMEFLEAWETIRFPVGHSPLEYAIEQAKLQPVWVERMSRYVSAEPRQSLEQSLEHPHGSG